MRNSAFVLLALLAGCTSAPSPEASRPLATLPDGCSPQEISAAESNAAKLQSLVPEASTSDSDVSDEELLAEVDAGADAGEAWALLEDLRARCGSGR